MRSPSWDALSLQASRNPQMAATFCLLDRVDISGGFDRVQSVGEFGVADVGAVTGWALTFGLLPCIPNHVARDACPSAGAPSTSSCTMRPMQPYSAGIDRPPRPSAFISPMIAGGIASVSAMPASLGTSRSQRKRVELARGAPRFSAWRIMKFFALRAAPSGLTPRGHRIAT